MHWLYNYWFNYEWPSLKGNGPEAITQTVVYGAVAIALIPVIRKFIRTELAKAGDEVVKVEQEIAKVEHWAVRVLKSPAALVKFLSRVRVTTKEIQVLDKAGSLVEAADPALTPEVSAVEKVAATAEDVTHPQTTMSAR